MRKESYERHWMVERRVPVVVIITLMVQMGGALVWATQLDARVGDMERETLSSSGLNEKFARLEERLDNMKQDLAGMKRQLDHLTDKLAGR
jgi:Tfp pilus assembly protein PilO